MPSKPTKTKTFGQRSFSYAGPVIWDKPPYDMRNLQNSNRNLIQAMVIMVVPPIQTTHRKATL